MATGRLGNLAIAATTNTTVYTVPTGYYTVCNVCVVNRNATAIKIRLAMAATGTPSVQEWIEYETIIVPNGVFERTGLVAGNALNIVAYASAGSAVNVTVYGIETSVV